MFLQVLYAVGMTWMGAHELGNILALARRHPLPEHGRLFYVITGNGHQVKTYLIGLRFMLA